ncbi:MAG: hypothetical protein V7K77_13055 [Nostoc sp.]|uniref:type II toxin-antitoxin system VapC family toxin n=1 Tax=Nostoc sp. TaxID=1180 RepID=UPI002FF74078
MVIGDGNPVFLDTNILVYASQIQSPFHQAAIEIIQGFYDAGVDLWISRQVLRCGNIWLPLPVRNNLPTHYPLQ